MGKKSRKIILDDSCTNHIYAYKLMGKKSKKNNLDSKLLKEVSAFMNNLYQ